MQQKRLILAIAISMFILIFFQQMQQPPPESTSDQETVEADSQSVAKKTTSQSGETEKSAEDDEKEKEKTDRDYEIIKLTSDNIILGVNSLNSGLSKVKIKDKNGEFINLVRSKKYEHAPLKLLTGDWKLTKNSRDNEITAEYSTEKLEVVRKYRVENGLVKITNNFENKELAAREVKIKQGWYNGLDTTADLEEENHEDTRLFLKKGEDIEDDLEKSEISDDLKWGGIMNRFFISAFLNLEQNFDTVTTKNTKTGGGGCSGSPEDAAFPEIEFTGTKILEGQEDYSFNQEFYIGLKNYTVLKSFDEELDKTLSFGIFGFLSRLFLGVLTTFYGWVGNYGIAIIMLTFLLQIFIFPLTIKSFKSMSEMKKLQPKMKKIRDKFEDDPQRMNEEIMHLYKKHKVNPLGGCFPLILQMPIFISLFTMLRAAAELRFASFLWIKDLAQPDVLFKAVPLLNEIPVIGSAGPLPLFMGGAMFLQQKVTGGSTGPQKNLTYIMPVVFTFLFMRFPAGLVLYWLTNSLLTFIVQYTVSKKKD
ncbi:MAG: membrane protein insertase YidC [Elusimicrobiota bacterium]